MDLKWHYWATVLLGVFIILLKYLQGMFKSSLSFQSQYTRIIKKIRRIERAGTILTISAVQRVPVTSDFPIGFPQSS